MSAGFALIKMSLVKYDFQKGNSCYGFQTKKAPEDPSSPRMTEQMKILCRSLKSTYRALKADRKSSLDAPIDFSNLSINRTQIVYLELVSPGYHELSTSRNNFRFP